MQLAKKKILNKDFLNNAVFSNIVWLFFDKIIRLVLTILVMSKIANYLKLESFGKLNYSMAFITIFYPVVNLGLENVIIKQVIDYKENVKKILTTGFYIKLISSFLGFIVSNLIGLYLFDIHSQNYLLIFIISFTFFFTPFEIIEAKFQAELRSRISTISKFISFFLSSALKLFLIYGNFSLKFFAYAIVLEAMISYLIITSIFYSESNFNILNLKHYSTKTAKLILTNNWSFFFSSLSIIIYSKIDQIMLGKISNTELGLYSAAIKLSEIWYTIPMIIIPSFYPFLIKRKNINVSNEKIFLILAIILISISTLISTLIFLYSDTLINLMYDSSYQKSSLMLKIHIWTNIAVFMGVFYNYRFFLMEKQSFVLISTVFGAVINILLNLVLLPKYGGIGASIATLISYSMVTLILIFTKSYLSKKQ